MKTPIPKKVCSLESLQNFCIDIIDTSLLWTGKDEERNPGLKRIRTLAGHFLEQIEVVKKN